MFYVAFAVVLLCVLLWMVESIGPADAKVRRLIEVIIVLAFAFLVVMRPTVF